MTIEQYKKLPLSEKMKFLNKVNKGEIKFSDEFDPDDLLKGFKK